MRLFGFVVFVASLDAPLVGQTVSFGTIGGVTPTADYHPSISTFRLDDTTTRTQTTTTERWAPVVGVKVEFALSGNWSLEADLVRMKYRGNSVVRFNPPYQPFPDRPPIVGGQFALSEFAVDIPVLGKYRFVAPFGLRPFLEGGISFRPWSAPSSISRRGYIVGGGLQFRKGSFVIEPTVRLTRWPLGYLAFLGQANQNQLQILLGVHRAMPSGLQSRLNRNLSLGLLGGFSFLNDYPDKDGERGYRSKLVGVAVDYRLSPKWSVEVDALYHPLILSERQQATVITWGFPLLAKYRMSARRAQPFLEAGPSLRFAGNTNGTSPSHLGATAGVGVEVQWHKLKIAPVLRFNYRTPDGPSFYGGQTTRNQLRFLVGFSR